MKMDSFARFVGIVFIALGLPWNTSADMTCRPGAPFALSVDGSSLSLDSKNACLGAVLETLARRTDAQVDLPTSLADRRVADTFHNLSVEQGVKRILKGTNYVLQTSGQTDPLAGESAFEPERIEVWVLSTKPTLLTRGGPNEQLTPVSQEEDDTIALRALAEQARSALNPEVRALAAQLITQTDDSAAGAEMILAGMQDPAPEVRSAALAVAGDVGPRAVVAVNLITQIALHDLSPRLRRQALQQLLEADVPTAIAAETLRTAIHDEDEEVSDLARNLLNFLGP